ncbi:MAG: hypothetical protein ACOZBW_02905 [Thermodesulfobacteriota bacterium]
MAQQPKNSDWVFVAAEAAGDWAGQFVAYRDESAGVSYIPVFYKKEDAQACFINLPREKGKKYEIQAVMFEDLAKDAGASGCLIFMLDAEGHILLKIDPATVA